MTAQPNPYVKVYYSIVDDEKFASVYDNDAALATWLRLLLLADGTYPAPAPLPVSARSKIVAQLADVGLIDLVPGRRFFVHGLASEREKRSDAGRTGAAVRWHSDRNANALVPHSEPNASPLHSKQSNSTPLQADAFETYMRCTGSFPSKKATPWLSDLVDEFGEEAVIEALVVVWSEDPDFKSYLGRVTDSLRAEAHRSAKESEERRKAADAEYQRQERERIANASPEEQARAAEIRDGIRAFVGGLPRG